MPEMWTGAQTALYFIYIYGMKEGGFSHVEQLYSDKITGDMQFLNSLDVI